MQENGDVKALEGGTGSTESAPVKPEPAANTAARLLASDVTGALRSAQSETVLAAQEQSSQSEGASEAEELGASRDEGLEVSGTEDWLTDFVALRLLSKPWAGFPQVTREGPVGLLRWLTQRGLGYKQMRLGRDKGGRVIFTLENTGYSSNTEVLQRYRLTRAFVAGLGYHQRAFLRELVLRNEPASRRWGEGVTPEEVLLLLEVCGVKTLGVPQVRLGMNR